MKLELSLCSHLQVFIEHFNFRLNHMNVYQHLVVCLSNDPLRKVPQHSNHHFRSVNEKRKKINVRVVNRVTRFNFVFIATFSNVSAFEDD